jgi:hypothetical protein
MGASQGLAKMAPMAQQPFLGLRPQPRPFHRVEFTSESGPHIRAAVSFTGLTDGNPLEVLSNGHLSGIAMLCRPLPLTAFDLSGEVS